MPYLLGEPVPEVSLNQVCALSGDGKIIGEDKAGSEPARSRNVLRHAWFRGCKSMEARRAARSQRLALPRTASLVFS
ncbi:MAG: hypothetical protein JO283_11040 [Bradyrhizobium sp.]|nr:hypothetical protein [Bradyrhizobium sp.]